MTARERECKNYRAQLLLMALDNLKEESNKLKALNSWLTVKPENQNF